MKITLKDGSVREYAETKSVLEIAKDLSEGLARAACAGEIDGERVDLRTKVDRDCRLNILTFEEKGGRDAFRHTASHILAQALKRLYPNVKLAIGPSVDDGFYYDVDSEEPLSADDFPAIEAEMKKIVKENLALERYELPREEAIRFFEEKGEPYKVELIRDLPEDAAISLYRQGEFTDLCAGPHLMSTKAVKAVKLMKIAGAYWRGSEKNKMLTRIYGTAYPKSSDLEAYLTMLEEAKKRDHRKLGKELELFLFADEGPGFPFFLPKGMVLKNTLMQYWREIHEREGYVEISTPIMLNRRLWETSGHWEHYKENMYTTIIDGEDFAVKPMNCPGGMLVYKSKPHSYRELPLRIAEVGLVHRHEKSGALHGLSLIHISDSTRPEDSMGSDEDWELATEGLRKALEDMQLDYTVNEGDGAFYGPKIDFHLVDAIGRTWQCGTIQLDFQLPQRFEAEYIGADGEMHRPIMIHRVCFGSIERFIGILTEHFAGKFPTWLSPVQVKILPISDKHIGYGAQVMARLKEAGIRCELDERPEKIGYKIREARNERVPYMLVVGQKEEENGLVSVRSRFAGDEGQKELELFISELSEEISKRQMREETAAED